MNWYTIFKKASPSEQDALKILGLGGLPSLLDLTKLRRKLNKQHHPDLGGEHAVIARYNDAMDVLERVILKQQKGQNANTQWPSRPSPAYNSTYSRPSEGNQSVPPWQTDTRSYYNELGRDWTNINRC